MAAFLSMTFGALMRPDPPHLVGRVEANVTGGCRSEKKVRIPAGQQMRRRLGGWKDCYQSEARKLGGRKQKQLVPSFMQ